ncbi:MAG: hypothetical protein ACRCUT_09405 [Spirochaetota bacterium]
MKLNEKYPAVLADKRTATLSIMISAIIGAVLSSIDNRISSGPANLLSLHLTFSAEKFSSLISLWSGDSLQLFIRYIRMDIVFALSYSIALSSIAAVMWNHLLSLMSVKNEEPGRFLKAAFLAGLTFPYLAAIANIGGNLLLYTAIRYEQITSPVIIAASFFAAAQYLLLALSVAIIFALLAMRRRRMHLSK